MFYTKNVSDFKLNNKLNIIHGTMQFLIGDMTIQGEWRQCDKDNNDRDIWSYSSKN